MSTLGDIRTSDALDNVANSFYMFALTVGMITVDEIDINALTINDSLTLAYADSNSVLYVDGSKDVKSQVLTNGQLQIGSTGAAPVVATITGSNGISVTNAAGSISLGLTNYAANVVTTNVLKFGTAQVGMTGTRNLTYYRIGNIMFITVYIQLSAKGSSTGTAYITLPVIPATAGSIAASWIDHTISNAGQMRTCYILFSGANIDAQLSTSDSMVNDITSFAMDNASFTDSTIISFTGFYFV